MASQSGSLGRVWISARRDDGSSPSYYVEAHEASSRIIDVMTVQRPSFWLEFGSRLGKALLPLAWRYVSKRMPLEEEAAWREAERRGQGDEWLRGRQRK